MSPVRTLVVHCPEWPVVATGLSLARPVAVVASGRVVACSVPARDEGVEAGLRRRQAEARCPSLVVVEHDPARDVRAFEPVVAAVESFAPRVEVTRPGTCSLATRGPSRYFGGDEALAARVAEQVSTVTAGACRVGVADGPFAAEQAAHAGTIVPPGGSAAFLASLPVSVLEPAVDTLADGSALVDLWERLGIRTLGDLAVLPAAAVLGRFGPAGAVAHRLARGLDDRPLWARTPPPDLATAAELDPPVESVETAAFVAKTLADGLFARLAEQGLAATSVGIEAETEHGESLARLWRLPAGLDAAALAQRVRWQLEGWLLASGGDRPTAGLTLLRLAPDEVRPDHGRQLGFWGGEGAGAERAARALARLQGMLGHEAVVTGVVAGGRGPAEEARLVPWGDEPSVDGAGRPERRRLLHSTGGEIPPWPGHLPPPAPAIVHSEPRPAAVVDTAGTPVGVTGRAGATGAPARLSIDGGPWADVAAWAGPWPCDERWWDARNHRRRARWQVVTTTGAAHLLAVEGGRWSVEATYD
ncbi:MAG TPA: DNA polymerase Y family protein [Acidimicrobiales bacterium]|nr:DNA polymerase Y family protein [Acidimicrobiales bacterium]